jgi:cystathionine gamma-synthase
MRDVIGYEEKEPRVLSALQSGYPRFFENPLITRLADYWKEQEGLSERTLYFCADEVVARRLVAFAGSGEIKRFGVDGQLVGVAFASADCSALERAQIYLRRTGTGISSREAEDWLVALGLLNAPFPEDRRAGCEQAILDELSRAGGGPVSHMRLTRSGMNAFYAAFEAVNALARSRGRRRWVRLGWLYVDTMDILGCMGDVPPLVWNNVRDLDGLRAHLLEQADDIAGIVVETPTNPLFDQVDLDELARLAKDIGAYLVIDPSLVSLWNAPDWSGADLLVCSLTKYAAGAGDVMAGLVAVNPDRPDAEELLRLVEHFTTSLGSQDCSRLAAEVGEAAAFLAHVNQTLPRVVEFLQSHSLVERVWAPDLDGSRGYRGSGAVCSFTIRGSLSGFYDTLQMAKGPSFGAYFSLLSPYMWLAHYNVIKSSAGARQFISADAEADLLRLSVGWETSEAIIEVLERSLQSL